MEAIRLLRNALHTSTRTRVVGWLLQALHDTQELGYVDDREQEELQITVLDSLAYLAWQAQKRSHNKPCWILGLEVFQDTAPLRLLSISKCLGTATQH